MSEAENIIQNKIIDAFQGIKSNTYEFDSWRDLTDEWLEENEDLFEYYSNEDEIFLLPAFLCYLLRNFGSSQESIIYEHIFGSLRQYSKDKQRGSFKYLLNDIQFNAIKSFIKHFRYNLPINLEEDLWERTLKNWNRD